MLSCLIPQPHLSVRIPHSAFRIPHSAFRIPHSAVRKLIPGSSIQVAHFWRKVLYPMAVAVLLTGSLTACKTLEPLSPPSNFAFNNSTTAYSTSNAYLLTEASYLAYQDSGLHLIGGVTKCDETVAKKWGFRECVNFPEVVKGNGSPAIMLINEDLIILAFRGTDNWNDFKTDINAIQINFDGTDPKGFDHFYEPGKGDSGKVHSGFLNYWKQIAPDIQARLNSEHEKGPHHVWVTGHSLGGALAVLAVASLNFKDEFSGLYTFGQPRVGDKKFSGTFNKKFASKTFRLTRNNDWVTDVPLKPSYCHVGTCLFIDSEKNMHMCPAELPVADHLRGFINGIREGKISLKQAGIGGHLDELYAIDLQNRDDATIYTIDDTCQ